jgi:hypothetical protein
VLVRAYSVKHLSCAGTWRLPVSKRLQAGNLETFELVAAVLNNQVNAPRVWRAGDDVVAPPLELPLTALRITSALDATAE